MNRSNKSKIAVTLLGALAFGANAQAQDFDKNKITKADSFSTIKDSKLGSRNERIEKGVSVLKKGLWKKVLIGIGITAGAGVLANEAAGGVTWAMGKESDGIFKGKYSFMNLLRSKLKKDDDQNPNPDKKKNIKNDLEGFLEKFEKAKIINEGKGDGLNSAYEKLKGNLIAVYNKVSKSNNCNEFYNKTGQSGMQEGDEPVANAILNFIVGEKKFDTNLNVSEVLSRGIFFVKINEVDYFFVNDVNNNIKVVGNGRVILII